MDIPVSPTTTTFTTALTNQTASSGLPVVTPTETSAQKDSASTGGLTQLFAHLLAQLKAKTGGTDEKSTTLLPGAALISAPTTAASTVPETTETTPAETEKTDNPETGSLTASEEETASPGSAVYLQALVPYVPVVTADLSAPSPIAFSLNSTREAVSSVATSPIDTSTTSVVVSTAPISYVPVVSINTPRTMLEQRLAALMPEPITGPTQKQADPVSAASPLPSFLPDNAPSVDAPTVPTVAAPAAQTAPTTQQAAVPQTITVSELNVQNMLDLVQAAPQTGLYFSQHSSAPIAQVMSDTFVVPVAPVTSTVSALRTPRSEGYATPSTVSVPTPTAPTIAVPTVVTERSIAPATSVELEPHAVKSAGNTTSSIVAATTASPAAGPTVQTVTAPAVTMGSVTSDAPANPMAPALRAVKGDANVTPPALAAQTVSEPPVVLAPRTVRSDRDITPSTVTVPTVTAPRAATPVPAASATNVPTVPTVAATAGQTAAAPKVTGSVTPETKQTDSVPARVLNASRPLPQAVSQVAAQNTPDPKPVSVKTERPAIEKQGQTAPHAAAPAVATAPKQTTAAERPAVPAHLAAKGDGNAAPSRLATPMGAAPTTISGRSVSPEGPVVLAPLTAMSNRDVTPSTVTTPQAVAPMTAIPVSPAPAPAVPAAPATNVPTVPTVAATAGQTAPAPTMTGSVTPETKQTDRVPARVPDASRPLPQAVSQVAAQNTPDPKPSVVPGQTTPRTVTPAVKAAPKQTTAAERSVTKPTAVSDNSKVSTQPITTEANAAKNTENGNEKTTPQDLPAQTAPRETLPVDRSRPTIVAATPTTTPDAATAPLFSEKNDRTDLNKTQTDKTQPETTIAAVKTGTSGPIASATSVPATDVPVEDVQPDNRHIAMARPTTTSPESTTAALSTSHHPASEEKGDAAPSERRASSDAHPTPHTETEAGSPTGSAKPADTMPIEKSIERSVEKAAAPQPATQSGHDRVRVVEQVTQKIEALRLTNGRQESTVHLSPENLGDLRLTIITDRDRVTAHVVAETAFARQAVEEGRDQLRAALEQKGFSLQGLDVSLNQSGGHNAADRRFLPFEQPAQSQSRSYRNDLVQETAPIAPPARATSINSQTRLKGRVDYTA